MNKFKELGLSTRIVEVLDKIGFTEPTPVQEQAIPQLLTNNPTDFIGLAQTGTGKTAAFGLPLLDLIQADLKAVQAIIMAPTRELSQQTASQLVNFSSNNPDIKVEVVYGGAAISNQIKALKQIPKIVVATPGRLIDLLDRKALSLEQVRFVILDEADEMLNMGFKEDIDNILSHTPSERVTWLFSATMPPEIRKIVTRYMKSPIEVAVNAEEKSNKNILHQYVITKSANRLAAIRRFMEIQPEMRGIMFCRTKRETQQIADELSSLGYGVEALHGDLSQGQRDAVMKRFKTRSMQLLIATDVAARGIDVDNLTHVINHSLPDQLESYTHRSGRTARAGKKGISLVFINPREGRRITELEQKIKVKFEQVKVPSIDELKYSRMSHWAHLISNTQVDENAGHILTQLEEYFSSLSKEDILKRLITQQLDHLMDESSELNEEIAGKTSGKGDYSSRSRGGEKVNRYYVNIGSIDGLTKGDLIHFISDISGLDRNLISDMSMQKNHSYFNVDSRQDKGLSNKFKGIEIEGRSIRVNRDDEKEAVTEKPKQDKKKHHRGQRNTNTGRRSRKRR
ncbi:MAG: DEAD/DEAH box helicase [Bacteroidota bacterium]